MYDLVMYTRTNGCPFVTLAKRVLSDYDVPYREVFIDIDPEAYQRVLDWTGFASVPTLVVAEHGQAVPFAPVSKLPIGHSPRGVHRGAMITEPNVQELCAWLLEYGFITQGDLDETSH